MLTIRITNTNTFLKRVAKGLFIRSGTRQRFVVFDPVSDRAFVFDLDDGNPRAVDKTTCQVPFFEQSFRAPLVGLENN